MRSGGGIIEGLKTTAAVHVADLDNHLRAMRATNAQLRGHIASLRSQLSKAVAEREQRAELQRALGARILAVESELGQARVRAYEHLAAIDAAADQEILRIVALGRAQALQVQRALDSVVGSGAPADVVLLTPRPVIAAVGDVASVHDRSVAM